VQLGVQAQARAFVGQGAQKLVISNQEPFKLACELPNGGRTV
jgi:hypothetical protein